MSTITSSRAFDTATDMPGDGRAVRTGVVIGSTREGRVGAGIAGWFAERTRKHPGLEVDLIDLAEFDLPAVFPRQPTAAMTEFAVRIERADAFVVVTPEYNHGYPASLKQAIDYGCDEWFAKPVGFVAYGITGQGLRAVEQLRLVFAALHTVTIPAAVSFDLLDGSVDHDGRPLDSVDLDLATGRLLDQLTWWALALRAARSARPYAA